MAGVTDKPFRLLCRGMGADACVSEMTSSAPGASASEVSRRRRDVRDEPMLRIIQIAGADPVRMAEAARECIAAGADVVDINMGCPAKKVCNAMAGSALLRDEKLVGKILDAVVAASDVPVTLKIRTGWDRHNRNAPNIAAIAERAGISLLTVHGRTRACRFDGIAEHDTTAMIKSRVSIPVIANGDITTAAEAARVLHHTGADGVMIGRAAMGDPWIFSRIRQYLEDAIPAAPPSLQEIRDVVIRHLEAIHSFYGDYIGVRVARKHIYWYCGSMPGFDRLRTLVCREEDGGRQLQRVREFLEPDRCGRLAA